MRGASLTMLHQPTPRTDLEQWAKDTANVIDMIEAKAVIVSDPFLVGVPVLEERGVKVLTVEALLAADPIDPIETSEDDVALMQLTSGSTGSSPKTPSQGSGRKGPLSERPAQLNRLPTRIEPAAPSSAAPAQRPGASRPSSRASNASNRNCEGEAGS